jgi:chitin deacetylase
VVLHNSSNPVSLANLRFLLPRQLDNRVRFIAENVFNLITVTWNRDSRDWAIPSLFDQTVQKSVDEVRSYVNGSKSPGMNILEHELNDACVTVFETVYTDYVNDGWDIRNLVSLVGRRRL